MHFGRRAGTHFTSTQNLAEEKPGHTSSPLTHLLPLRCACVYVSHSMSTGVWRLACSLKHILGDRGVIQWLLTTDRPLTVNSFTPVKKHPAHLPGPFNSADPSDLLHRPSPPPPPPPLSPPEHWTLCLWRGSIINFLEKAHKSCQWRWRAVVLRALGKGMAVWVCLIIGHRPSLPCDLWCCSEPHTTHITIAEKGNCVTFMCC